MKQYLIAIILTLIILNPSFSSAEQGQSDAESYNHHGWSNVINFKYDQAISDFNKAIEINPKFGQAYYNRAYAYYSKKEYSKAWNDIDKAEQFGYNAYPGFLEALKNESGRVSQMVQDATSSRQLTPLSSNTAVSGANQGLSGAAIHTPEEAERFYKAQDKIWNLRQAVIHNDLEKAATAIADGADVNKDIPLCIAVSNGNKEMVKLLLANGANPSLQDKSFNGYTPLHYACLNSNKPLINEIVELLLTNGAYVNARDYSQDTPLIMLISHGGGNRKIAELLVEKGADVNSLGYEGGTPLGYAVMSRNKGIAELLIKKGANVNDRNSYGYTLLMTASTTAMMDGYTDIVELLISAGADVNARDNEGKTLLTQLEAFKSTMPNLKGDNIISLLKAHGATH